jgi:hypothetical protein
VPVPNLYCSLVRGLIQIERYLHAQGLPSNARVCVRVSDDLNPPGCGNVTCLSIVATFPRVRLYPYLFACATSAKHADSLPHIVHTRQ